MKIVESKRPHRRYFVVLALVFAFCSPLLVGLGNVASAVENEEKIALSLVTFLRSAGAVISDKQKHFNDASIGD